MHSTLFWNEHIGKSCAAIPELLLRTGAEELIDYISNIF